MNIRGAVVLGLIALTGCSSMPTVSSLTGGAPEQPREAFAYRAATDGRVRVDVESVTLKGESGFIPTDRNWLQVNIRITNKSGRMIEVSEVGERLVDGTVIKAAKSAEDLVKPPLIKDMAVSSGLTVGTMMFFPPMAVAGAIAGVAYPLYSANKSGRLMERLNQEGLHQGPIAPGTSTTGLIFLPAVKDQAGLILFYEVDGKKQSIVIERAQ